MNTTSDGTYQISSLLRHMKGKATFTVGGISLLFQDIADKQQVSFLDVPLPASKLLYDQIVALRTGTQGDILI